MRIRADFPRKGDLAKDRDWEVTFEEERSQPPGPVPNWEEDLVGK